MRRKGLASVLVAMALVIGAMFSGISGGVAVAHDNCVLGDVHLSAIDLCLITSTGTEDGCALLPVVIPGLLDLCLINNIGDGDGDGDEDEDEEEEEETNHERSAAHDDDRGRGKKNGD